jgi:hypothetical protein
MPTQVSRWFLQQHTAASTDSLSFPSFSLINVCADHVSSMSHPTSTACSTPRGRCLTHNSQHARPHSKSEDVGSTHRPWRALDCSFAAVWSFQPSILIQRYHCTHVNRVHNQSVTHTARARQAMAPQSPPCAT